MLNGYEGPIFSPSQTAIYKECPLAWFMRYNYKYESRTYNHKEIAGCVGTAFSEYQEFLPGGHEQALDKAMDSLLHRLSVLKETRELSEKAVAYERTATDRLEKFVKLFRTTIVIPSGWTLYDRERAFDRWGRARVDSLYETSMGDNGVLDWKTRGRLQANQRDKAQREFATSNQLYHYCAMASHELQLDFNQFSICILTLEPKPWIALWQYRVKREFLKVWIAGRIQDWQDMDAIKRGERIPSPATEHENKYGKCQYHDACFKHGLDTDLIQQDFIIRG